VVDELQARADGVGIAAVRLVVAGEEPEHDAAHRVGGAAAVVHEFVEGRVALLRHVLPEGIEQVAKEGDRQVVRADRVVQAGNRVAGRAPRDPSRFPHSRRAAPGASVGAVPSSAKSSADRAKA
jgi:hypothetical protein